MFQKMNCEKKVAVFLDMLLHENFFIKTSFAYDCDV